MKLFENTWFIGIATGIISGILVFFITKWIMDKKGKAEYYRQVVMANNNVINSLKPYIADKGLPDIEIFKALISSTARIHGINDKDMYSVSIYCEELIREIISDVYVSNEKKQEYTASLAEYKKAIKQQREIEVQIVNTPIGIYGERLKRRMSVYMAVFTGFAGIICSFMTLDAIDESVNKELYILPYEEEPLMLVAAILMLIILMMVALMLTSELLLKITKKETKRYSTSKKNLDEDLEEHGKVN